MTEEERNYLSGATRHYSSLFTFPSYSTLLASMFTIVIISEIITFLMISYTVDSLFKAVILALGGLLLPTVLVDLIISLFFKDSLLNLRRLTALSTVATSGWALMIAAGTAFEVTTGLLGLVPSIFLGGSLIIGFRFLVIRSMASFSPLGTLTAIFLSSTLGLFVISFMLSPIPYIFLPVTALSVSLTILAGEIFLRIMNRHGKQVIGIGTLNLFHSFISDWLEGIAGPLEKYLEELAVPTNASTSLLRFVSKAKTQGSIVVSDIHPGPFKNVGSSNMPFEIQVALESKTGSLVIVPHGASGHERDLPSKRHRERLVKGIVEAVKFDDLSSLATPMIRWDLRDAHASCQLFGDIALVTLTCAPKSMEDVPFELGSKIIEEGKALGVKDVVVIDAHNSVGKTNDVPILSSQQLSDLKEAAESAIKAALSIRRASFKFGASRILPKEFRANEGIGPGGIAVAVINVQEQKVAYVTFDGNNIVTGLREEIRNSLKDMVDDSEVMATDTHIVNAISATERGYHPVGEVGDHGTYLSYIRTCTSEAIANLQESRLEYGRINVSEISVIGEEKLKKISLLVDSSVSLLKRLIVLIYGPIITLTILLFLFLP
jgi:putative membrane protein